MAALSLSPSNLAQATPSRQRLAFRTRPRAISAAKIPFSPSPSTPSGELYQPFRPPPSPVPAKFRSLDTAERIEVLRGRLGAWYEYCALIPALTQDGFTPATLEELSGIPSVEQNCLVVGAQVRDSLVTSGIDDDTLSYFDSGGAELLYELRLLSAAHRLAAARRVVEYRLSGKQAQELARAIKDYPRRRGDPGWEEFDRDSPGDCLAYSYFRQSKEAIVDSDRRTWLEKAMDAVETERARERLLQEMEKKKGEESEDEELTGSQTVPVVRMRYGEVAEATSVVVLPVAEAAEGSAVIMAAPACRAGGEFGIVTADAGWRRWVVLPRWDPLVLIEEGGRVAVAFPDARRLPWRANRSAMEEPTLVIVDRTRKVVEEEGFYLVGEGGESGMKVEKGRKLQPEEAERVIGAVALVVRPPVDEMDDQIADEDWD